jgi:dihydroorotate dehydrogenase
MYPSIFRPLFFQLDPERAHNLTVYLLRLAGAVSPVGYFLRQIFSSYSHEDIAVEAFGLKFSNPVGLAAGYDKDGLAWRGLTALGFGHIEIGTVTPRPQDGNPKPRVFRIPEEQAVINRMGFPGKGADIVLQQLSVPHRASTVIGINIGKNKDTPNEEAANDYVYLFEKFSSLADYLVVNVSSPNTVGLRRLQARDHLEDILLQLSDARLRSPVSRPILVKLAPDLTDEELDDALAAITATGMDGIIATNTTTDREGLHSPIGEEAGGLSGAPLTGKSRSMVAEVYRRTAGELPIIGVGGIMNPDDARSMLDAGASLIQVYTGLIYAGPGLVKQIVQSL